MIPKPDPADVARIAATAATARQEPDPTPDATPPPPDTAAPRTEPVREQAPAFKGGPFAVSLPKDAAQSLRLFDAHLVEPGGEPQVIHLPDGEVGEHQLVDLRRRFTVERATPAAAKPDQRMTATAKS